MANQVNDAVDMLSRLCDFCPFTAAGHAFDNHVIACGTLRCFACNGVEEGDLAFMEHLRGAQDVAHSSIRHRRRKCIIPTELS